MTFSAPSMWRISQRRALMTSRYAIRCSINYWLVVSTPLKNISQLGLLFPIYGKIKCSKPPTNYSIVPVLLVKFPYQSTFIVGILGILHDFSDDCSMVFPLKPEANHEKIPLPLPTVAFMKRRPLSSRSPACGEAPMSCLATGVQRMSQREQCGVQCGYWIFFR